jgi:ATP-dependent Lhr-like helicase
VEAIPEGLSERAVRILDFLRQQGAEFQATIHQATGGGFPKDTTDALWELVWAGLLTNDTYHPVRAMLTSREEEQQRGANSHLPPGSPGFLQRQRARRGASGQGRWSLVRQRIAAVPTPAEWSAALAQQLLVRNGIVMRETAAAEDVKGGYPSVYPALKTMEESGWIRRGMFVAGLGAAQFATPAAVDLLRSLRHPMDRAEAVHLAASDPANPYGSLLPWLEGSTDHGMSRAAGANVVIVEGRLAAYFRRRNPAMRVFLPEEEPERSRVARELAQKLALIAIRHQTKRSGLLIGTINDEPASEHFMARMLEDSGFVPTPAGFQMRRIVPGREAAELPDEDSTDDA